MVGGMNGRRKGDLPVCVFKRLFLFCRKRLVVGATDAASIFGTPHHRNPLGILVNSRQFLLSIYRNNLPVSMFKSQVSTANLFPSNVW